ncbi:hypothetical protein F2Q68_00026223 [Brassica cretica]|uniref:Uncharacterized protein n=1 Tax=Brassica cretica TaxID=69181 RepID=A0A8S9I8L6_BRACR|nr:hypothetical protein F2Q68_00026223 [Brassica cretica]
MMVASSEAIIGHRSDDGGIIGRSVTLLRGGHGKGIEAKVLQIVVIRRRSMVRLGG